MDPDRTPAELWDEYCSLQHQASRITTVGPSSWAVEDQLNTFLELLSNNDLSPSPDARQRQLNNLKVNRQKKHLHRFTLLQCFALAQSEASYGKTALDEAIQAERLSKVRSLTSQAEWSVLLELAAGESYESLALDLGLSGSALKTRVSRCRCRLRNSLAA